MEIDLNGKCRVCLTDDKQMHNLFDEFDKGITLRDILINTTGFEVENEDGFSPHICQNCTTIIVDFYNLKTIYEENETQIKALITDTTNSKISKDCETSNESLGASDFQETRQPAEADAAEDYITIKVESYGSDDDSTVDEIQSRQDHSYSEVNDLEENSYNMNEQEINSDCKDSSEEYEYQEINTYTCPECGDCFLYKNDIHAHMVSKHDIMEVDFDEISELSLLKVKKEDISSSNKCKVCNQYFSDVETYKQHLQTHKKNVCDICGVGFIKKSYLKDHQEIHCTEKRHVCNYCNKAFKRRTVLVKHRRIHTHPRECICEICGKAFNDKGTLKTHIMLLHIRERNYMCLICGVKFPLKATLEKHIRRHQNKEREFFCTQCPLGYRDKSSLDRHIYVKHSGENVKVTCSDCGKQYTTVTNLYKHQRVCHNASMEAVVSEQSE